MTAHYEEFVTHFKKLLEIEKQCEVDELQRLLSTLPLSVFFCIFQFSGLTEFSLTLVLSSGTGTSWSCTPSSRTCRSMQ
jgi:hypothetical protein